MMSLYAEYLRERTNIQIIESDFGYVTYEFLNEKQVYIRDIYIVPDERLGGEASAMADKVCELARARGCKEVLGSVVPSAKGSTASLRVLLAYGMLLDSSTNDLIVFKKDL